MPDQYAEDLMYMDIARRVADRSHDPKGGVGCVIVADHQLTVGWNGTPAFLPNETREPHLHRTEFGLYLKMRTKPVVVHAEMNALSKFMSQKISTADATLYTTLGCCIPCAAMAVRAKISRVVYCDVHKKGEGIQYLKDRGITIVRM